MLGGDTKLIVITSNDDLIRKISSNNWSNTNIIDLDDVPLGSTQLNRTNATIAEIAPSDLNIFFELSQLNNQNNDEVYHDQLNSSRDVQSKSLKMTRKSLNSQCLICDDRAIGFNYDVLSCASCKAFFRRNAHHLIENLRCLTGRNDCSIRSSDRRKCQRCRLEKCFKMGMRKDFILSEEEKQRRKQKSQLNNSTTNSISSSQTSISLEQESMDLNEASKSLENWIEGEILRSNYSTIFSTDEFCDGKIDLSDRLAALATWSEMASQSAMKLIDFFRQVDRFECLNNDDRFFLIKANLFPIVFLHKSLRFNYQTNCFIDVSDEDRRRRHQFFNLCYGKNPIREEFLLLMRRLSEIIQRDVTLTCLVLVSLLFTKGLSMIDDEGILKESTDVFRCQNHFIELTMNYLIEQKGYDQAMKQITQIILSFSQIQNLTRKFRLFFHSQLQSEDVSQHIAPLMKSVLNIS